MLIILVFLYYFGFAASVPLTGRFNSGVRPHLSGDSGKWFDRGDLNADGTELLTQRHVAQASRLRSVSTWQAGRLPYSLRLHSSVSLRWFLFAVSSLRFRPWISAIWLPCRA
jgi:hypothetical protein